MAALGYADRCFRPASQIHVQRLYVALVQVASEQHEPKQARKWDDQAGETAEERYRQNKKNEKIPNKPYSLTSMIQKKS